MLDLTELDDRHLRALSKALHEARFCQEPNDPVVAGSPLVVDLHVWTLAEQRRRDQAAGLDTDWDGWLMWSGRDEVHAVVRRLRSSASLLDMVTADPAILRDMLRPFEVDDESLEAMIGDARFDTD